MERFYEKVEPEPNSGCWLWTAYVHRITGYGEFRFNGRARQAHRVAWELERGPIPDGMWVLHKCDVPGCVNVDHLFLGTHQDNMDDMMAKGRGARGAALPHTKLTIEDVIEVRRLRAAGMTYKALGEMFGVTRRALRDLVNGVNWKHVKEGL